MPCCARVRALCSGKIPTYTASADRWRSTLADTASVALRRGFTHPVNQHALRYRRLVRQHQQVLGTAPQQPLGTVRAVGLRSDRGGAHERTVGRARRVRHAQLRLGAHGDARPHAHRQLREQRLAAERIAERGARGTGSEARQRCRQNVHARTPMATL